MHEKTSLPCQDSKSGPSSQYTVIYIRVSFDFWVYLTYLYVPHTYTHYDMAYQSFDLTLQRYKSTVLNDSLS
jgi:hypothetical protein